MFVCHPVAHLSWYAALVDRSGENFVAQYHLLARSASLPRKPCSFLVVTRVVLSAVDEA